MLTIDDLRNPKRKSGFNYVKVTWGGGNQKNNPITKYQSQHGSSKVGTRLGKRRATAEEAAQDYCNHVNGRNVQPIPALNNPGHAVRPKLPVMSEEVADALGVLRDARAQRMGRQGYVYCIGERSGGNQGYVKIGYSVNPEARVGELQTGNPRVLYLVAKMPGTEADEKRIHAKFIHKNVVGEWFHRDYDVLEEFAGHYVWPERMKTYN